VVDQLVLALLLERDDDERHEDVDEEERKDDEVDDVEDGHLHAIARLRTAVLPRRVDRVLQHSAVTTACQIYPPHCKNVRISAVTIQRHLRHTVKMSCVTDIDLVCVVERYDLTELKEYYYYYYYVRISADIWAQASLFPRFTDTNVYGTGSVKIRKTRH